MGTNRLVEMKVFCFLVALAHVEAFGGFSELKVESQDCPTDTYSDGVACTPCVPQTEEEKQAVEEWNNGTRESCMKSCMWILQDMWVGLAGSGIVEPSVQEMEAQCEERCKKRCPAP